MGERLRGLDAAFLAIETASNHMHTAVLARLDPATAPPAAPWSFAALREHLAGRLHTAPLFRRRVVEVPFGIHHPLWYDDPDFELGRHLHRLPVDAPGEPADLARAVAGALAVPLARDRPLWELHVAEGLAGGGAAVLAKSHHAAHDGVSGTQVLVGLLDLQAEPWPSPGPEAPWAPPPLPGPEELLGEAVAALGERPAETAAAVRGTVELVTRLRHHLGGGRDDGAPVPFQAPRTSLNVVLGGPERAVALAELPLARVRAVKDRHGVTVNDVVLALCAGALRRWMAERGEDPGSDLVALVPRSVRGEGDAAGPGNRVSPMLVSLATTVADPVARLAAVAASARAAKARERAVGTEVLADWAEVAPPAVVAGAAGLAAALRLAEVVPPPFNVSVSNLVGPPVPLYLAGARVTAAYPLGPVVDGNALNVTVLSYAGTLGVGLVADRCVTGLATMAAALPGELAALDAPTPGADGVE